MRYRQDIHAGIRIAYYIKKIAKTHISPRQKTHITSPTFKSRKTVLNVPVFPYDWWNQYTRPNLNCLGKASLTIIYLPQFSYDLYCSFSGVVFPDFFLKSVCKHRVVLWKITLIGFWSVSIAATRYSREKNWECQQVERLKLGGENIWAQSSEFVSSSIPSWQISTAHAQPFRGARDLAFCLKVPLDSLFVWASSEGSGETARMHRLAWTFAARIGDK